MNDITTINKPISTRRRIISLFNIQRAEKFKGTANIKNLIVSLVLHAIIIVGIALGIALGFSALRVATLFNCDENTLGFLLFIYMIISILSTVTTINTYLFRATDSEYLFSMPVKKSDVYTSKVLIALLQEYKSSVSLLLPIVIGFGIAISKRIPGSGVVMAYGWQYSIVAILLIVILPILCCAIGMLLAIIYNYIKRFVKRSTALSLAYYIILLVLFVWLFAYLVGLVVADVNIFADRYRIVAEINTFLRSFGNGAFVFSFIASAFAGNFLYVLYLFLITSALFVGAYFLVQLVYFHQVGVPATKKVTEKGSGQYRQLSYWLAIFKKDLMLISGDVSDTARYFSLTILSPFVVTLIDKLYNAFDLSLRGGRLVIGANILLIALLVGTSTLFCANAVSSEGDNLYIQKLSPVDFKYHMFSKIAINYAISSFFVIVCSVIFGVTTTNWWWQVILVCLIVLVLLFGMICLAYMLDLRKPTLYWTDKAQLSKNKNLIYQTINVVVTALVFGVIAMVMFYFIANQAIVWSILFVLACIYTATIVFVLGKTYHKHYVELLG